MFNYAPILEIAVLLKIFIPTIETFVVASALSTNPSEYYFLVVTLDSN